MPKLNQAGLTPILIIGLVLLGTVTAAGTYFVLNLTQTEQKAVNPVENPAPAPSVVETISVQEVKAANEETLLKMDGVEKVEVSEKDGKPCVVVFTFKETDEIKNLENNGIGGYEVVIENGAETKPL